MRAELESDPKDLQATQNKSTKSPKEPSLFPLDEDKGLNNAGDFRSKDCIELLKLADIVVTNPPFSLFREYVAQLVEYGKKFLIIGNQNNITYKETFSFIKENKLWLGRTLSYAAFKVPSYYEERSNRFWIDENGQKWRSFGNICWFTNLTHKKRTEILETIASYKKNPEKYPKYDNYDAINVDKTIEIPLDYNGVMGVPITFLDKHNPKQFEILSCHEPAILLETLRQIPKFKEYKSRQIVINGRVCQKTYHRIFIRKIAEVDELRKQEQEKM